jgi:hypothetical protein
MRRYETSVVGLLPVSLFSALPSICESRSQCRGWDEQLTRVLRPMVETVLRSHKVLR